MAKRKYGLFCRKPGEKKWERLYPMCSYYKETAVRLFQSELLNGTMNGWQMALRPVSVEIKTRS